MAVWARLGLLFEELRQCVGWSRVAGRRVGKRPAVKVEQTHRYAQQARAFAANDRENLHRGVEDTDMRLKLLISPLLFSFPVVHWMLPPGCRAQNGMLVATNAIALAPVVRNHSAPRVVRVALLQRMSDARMTSAELCGGAAGNWVDGTCWLGQGWRAVTAAGMAAANDFNARSGSYVPQFASEAMQACDVQLSVSVIDSGSTAMHALDQLVYRLTTHVLDESIAPDVRRQIPNSLLCACW